MPHMTRNRMITISLTLISTLHNFSRLPYVGTESLAILSRMVTWEMENISNKLAEFAKDISMLNF